MKLKEVPIEKFKNLRKPLDFKPSEIESPLPTIGQDNSNKLDWNDLTEQNKLLLTLAHLCLEKLPKDFQGYEVNNRLWKAFDLGRQYERLIKHKVRNK